eukprot:TRINITY_DN3651_c0_g1_i4.p1 TRINITY_DN3651_c0_g1~~TRINITY_DN3651_c0_g1_i4.p1  ORF type:complete len:548 (-),score=189.67 TRINITY_DN3651_c0_g1_i4:226-1869(-)
MSLCLEDRQLIESVRKAGKTKKSFLSSRAKEEWISGVLNGRLDGLKDKPLEVWHMVVEVQDNKPALEVLIEGGFMDLADELKSKMREFLVKKGVKPPLLKTNGENENSRVGKGKVLKKGVEEKNAVKERPGKKKEKEEKSALLIELVRSNDLDSIKAQFSPGDLRFFGRFAHAVKSPAALVEACWEGHDEIVHYLLECGVMWKSRGIRKASGLEIAVEKGHVHVVDQFAQHEKFQASSEFVNKLLSLCHNDEMVAAVKRIRTFDKQSDRKKEEKKSDARNICDNVVEETVTHDTQSQVTFALETEKTSETSENEEEIVPQLHEEVATESQSEELEKELSAVRQERETEIASQTSRVEELEKELSAVRQERETEIASQTSRVEELEKELSAVRQERETEIASQTSRVEELEKKVVASSSMAEELRSTFELVSDENKKQSARIRELEKEKSDSVEQLERALTHSLKIQSNFDKLKEEHVEVLKKWKRETSAKSASAKKATRSEKSEKSEKSGKMESGWNFSKWYFVPVIIGGLLVYFSRIIKPRFPHDF